MDRVEVRQIKSGRNIARGLANKVVKITLGIVNKAAKEALISIGSVKYVALANLRDIQL